MQRAKHAHSQLTYVRLTKLRGLSGPPSFKREEDLTGATGEGSPNHHVGEGYFVDGWFLEAPRVGSSMVLLRFRRNGTCRLGLFSSSPVTFIGDSEIHTENSVYHLEHVDQVSTQE